MKKLIKKMAVVLICALTLSTLFATMAQAAENKGSKINGSTKATTTFTVKTGDRGSLANYVYIKFTQGTLNGHNKFTGSKTTKKSYGRYNILITNTKTKRKSYQYAINKSSAKITLADNSTFQIEVVPLNDLHFEDMSIINLWQYTGWKAHATWKVTETKGVKSCAKVNNNYYTYNVVYLSSNGTTLGTSTARYKAGTTNTITPPAFSGYTTPAAQTVKWDSAQKTITFSYKPNTTSAPTFSGTWWAYKGSPVLTYKCTVETRNRTADSIEYRVKWTNSIVKNRYYGFTQKFEVKCAGASTGKVTICGPSVMGYKTMGKVRTATATSGWVKVTGLNSNTTSLSMQFNGFSDDNISFKKTIAIPTF